MESKHCELSIAVNREGMLHSGIPAFMFLHGRVNDMNIPQHVAIILDGNGRWAKSKGMPRNYGHIRGAKNLETICRDAYDIGIKYLTVYLSLIHI